MSRPDSISGRYFRPGTSKAEEARLTDKAGQLIVVVDASGERLPVELEELGDRLANVPRKILFSDGSLFESGDNDAIDLVFMQEKRLGSRLTRAEGSFRFVLMALVATVVFLVAFYRYGIPAIANFAAHATPSAIVSLIDDSVMETVDRLILVESKLEEGRKQELNGIFDELVTVSGQTDPPLKLRFRGGGRLGPNAVALPGGTVILTDELVALAENDDEIAGVLAHEIGHIEHRHSLRQIYRVLGLGFMISLVGGDSGQIVEEVVTQAALIDTLSYSRTFEIDADVHSVQVMHAAGRDPEAFINLLDRIIKTELGEDPSKDKTSWLSTHPGNADRRREVEAEIERLR